MSTVVDRLRGALGGQPKPLIICGAGVSVQASGGAAPDWAALIEAGIERAEGINPALKAWAVYARHRLHHEGAASWIEVADELTTRLGGQHNADFLELLEEKVGRLELRDTQLIDALLKLDCPLATTNYDDLLSQATNLPVVNWTDSQEVARCLSGRWKGIIHLHGHWRKPETVVLGTRSYNELISDDRNQLLGQMSALTRPTLFVGCSFDGISDPDFSELDRFIGQWQSASQPRFILVKGPTDAVPQFERRLYPVIYGTSHDELAAFLDRLADSPTAGEAPGKGTARCIDKRVPKTDLFGREAPLAEIVGASLAGRPVIIAGGPGMGKTALAVAAVYEDNVKQHYKNNRIFVSLDEATEPRALLAKLADELGLPAAGDEVSLLRTIDIYTSAQETLVILDNAELVFESQRIEAERILALASQISGLTIIMTIRGTAPRLPGAFVIDDLVKLSPAAAEEAFLAAAGPGFNDDPDLAGLVTALDGHALSTQLVAAQAAGTPRLKPLRNAWEEQHAAMVVSCSGETETRSTSLRASLALSLESPTMKQSPLSKKLISILAYLPAGLDEADVPKILGPIGRVNRVKAESAISVLHKLRLVERRLDGRLRMLNPLREAARLAVPIGALERRRLTDKFLKIASQCKAIGTVTWCRVKEVVEAERDNLDYVCLLAARRQITDDRVQEAIWSYGDLIKFTGIGDISSLEAGIEEARHKGEWSCVANLLFQLGNISFERWDFKSATSYYEHGLDATSVRGFEELNASCLIGLGRISMANSDHKDAENRFQSALAKVNNPTPLFAANIYNLLAVLRAREQLRDEAGTYLSKARALYKEDELGMANLWGCQAELNPEEAQELLRKAIDLCERIGSPGSLANRLNQLASLMMTRRDYRAVGALASQALVLSRSIGRAVSEAEALMRRGRAACYLGDPSGQIEVEEGIKLYLRVNSPADRARAGWLALDHALRSEDEAETKRFRLSAADEWSKVGRLDFVRHFADGLFPQSDIVLQPRG